MLQAIKQEGAGECMRVVFGRPFDLEGHFFVRTFFVLSVLPQLVIRAQQQAKVVSASVVAPL